MNACGRMGSRLLLVLLACSAGCRKAPEGIQSGGQTSVRWFENVTARSGIDFTHQVDIGGQYLFSEAIGSGAAFLDFDNDGRLDICLIHNVGPASSAKNRLFHQEADGRFKDVSAGSGLDVTGRGNGLAVGDLNNDGLPEILITEEQGIRLFLNAGQGRFVDITSAAGLTNRQWSVPAAFVDFDRDGWLDLVVGNYLDFDPSQRCPDAKGQPDFCGPHGFPATLTRLYRNAGATTGGASGKIFFEDVTVRSGLARVPGKAMEIVCADFDGDRWPDIFITDDGLPNRLFMNQHNGTFKEEAVVRGMAYTAMGAPAANMGVALGDVDGDGLFDVFVPHLAEENHTLWRQGVRGVFQDETARAGLLNPASHGTGFGAVFADFDGDGALDLAVANGLVRRRAGRTPPKIAAGIPPFWIPYAEPAQLFVNDGTGRFQEVVDAAFCGEAMVGRGLLCGDFDNDGAPDLLITAIASRAELLRNVAGRRGHWLGIRAVDPALGNRDAYGAEIVVRGGGRSWWRLVQPAYSFACSNDPRALFGLGALASADSIRIVWPDGMEEEFPGGTLDVYRVLRKGSGKFTQR
ncbi:MAG: enediyne biosynthesis protein [Verrucomicrobiota bacterium]